VLVKDLPAEKSMTIPSRSKYLALFAVAVFAIGCGGTAPRPTVFQMAFRETSAQQYVVCPVQGELYCMASYPSTRTFSGTLVLSGDSAVLSGDGSWASIIGTDNTGAEQIKFARFGCGFMTVNVVGTADTMSGSWSEQFDCHGLSGGGTFVGHRQ
jgi:hypothetical protein